MSGGSYNYLYNHLLSHGGLPGTHEGGYFDQMRKRVAELAPGSPAALEIEKLYQDIKQAEARFERLSEVMHDVEWADSCDITDEDAIETIKRCVAPD